MIEEISEELWDVIINSGSLVVDCECCNTTYFGTDEDFEEGELEELEEKMKKKPDRYHRFDGDTVSWGYVNGRQIVYKCGCKEGDKVMLNMENFIWNNRHIILNYLKDKTSNNLKDAKNDKEETENIDLYER